MPDRFSPLQPRAPGVPPSPLVFALYLSDNLTPNLYDISQLSISDGPVKHL